MVSFLSGIDYWKHCFEGMEDAGNALGVTTKYTGQTDSDVAGQVAVLEQVIAQSPKGIAVTCVNSGRPGGYHQLCQGAGDLCGVL